ncbi:MAG: Nramp family divalent metal transporter [Thermogemmatispora sp.]|jgi:NRAMP (natural resistance-associated macrophage protein)-like metal ion transporter|uniref:Nramp family divalent metal transporter n=1 Tax=Thermogemmatispora sp. TaxID=1968838 RepID=UPI0019DED54E|nr:Nramp family divalent metal transporter [Thermogemmatispora sp.]MBE3566413.1 Nramp family divalent metal transporter [Thermogemmatispora sp.]
MERSGQKTTELQRKDRATRRKPARSRFPFRLSRSSPLIRLLAVLGPGLIAANAGNDAGGIATYSSAGANYGYSLLWALFISSFFVAVIQEMCARMGAVTGKGLADLIREEFGVRWTALAMLALLIANTGITISEFLGIGASVQVLAQDVHTPWLYVTVPVCGLSLWWLVIKGSYRRVEKVFIAMSLGFLSYIPAAFVAHPDWGAIAHQSVLPNWSWDSGYLLMAAALVGTTISPYMLFYVQSAVADKGIHAGEYIYEQIDVYSGTLFATIISFFIVVATGATLFVSHHPVSTALDAAFALRNLAGPYASLLFGIGLFGASLLAAAVLPLSTAYAICEAFGFERSLSRSFREAPVFQGLFTALIALGVLVTLIPGLPIFQVLIVLQDINTAMLPIILVFIILLVNNRRLMGRHRNSLLFNIFGWATVLFVSVLTLILLIVNLLPH